MSKKLYEETDIQSIANSIREKNGLTTTYKVSEMAQAIKDIPSGSSGSDDSVLNSLIDGSATTVSSTATQVRSRAFYRLSSLTSIDFPEVIKIGDNAFTQCTALTSVNLPKTQEIRTYAFQLCSKLTYISLPKVTTIHISCFQDCSQLSTVDLGAIELFNSAAFKSCTALNTLIIRSSDVCILSAANVFSDTPLASGTGAIYVPDDLVDSYKSATNWSTFADLIKPLSEYTGE